MASTMRLWHRLAARATRYLIAAGTTAATTLACRESGIAVFSQENRANHELAL